MTIHDQPKMTNLPAPLAGVKVIELARILAGPWAGQALADLGADVVKVESLEGDDTRKWGPPFVTRQNDIASAYYHSCNRGKRSVAADFRTEEGRDLVVNLVRDAHVLIENFKTGGLAKYNLDYESLRKINPALVYCSITGFGQTGPYAHRPGYDYLLQGMGGLMSVTGEPDGPSQKVGVPAIDLYTGLYSATAILAALYQARETGVGQQIDMALLDVATAVVSQVGMNYLVSGEVPKRLGSAHANLSPYGVFRCSDGDIILAPGNDSQFRRLCGVLGLEALPDDARFLHNSNRLMNRDALVAALSGAVGGFTKRILLASCEANNVPAGPINKIDETFSDPQVQHRGMVMDLDGVPAVRSPFRFSKSKLKVARPAPALNEHGEEIKREFAKQ